MTITLDVRDVLRNPSPFAGHFRLVVSGLLHLDASCFRIYQITGRDSWDESIYLDIDDDDAVQKTRDSLMSAAREPDHLGVAFVEAWTSIRENGFVLTGVVQITLFDSQDEDGSINPLARALTIHVRPHPWGWDRGGSR